MLHLSTQAKEAIKTGLAMALAYGIALQMSWMNPYWAGFAVAMISLPTAGQSLFKGALRMAGTLLGCVAGLTVLALALQDRWGFMLLVSGWTFFTAYMMIGSRRAYFWHVSGFVCLIITLAGSSSSENIFAHAVARTVETAMGILVYTLVTVFIWPRTNAGALKQASKDLLATQEKLLKYCRARLHGHSSEKDGRALRTQQVKELGQLEQALHAEGSESYEVHEQRHLWARLEALSSALMASLDRWYVGFAELGQIDVRRVLPNLEEYYSELCWRFERIQRLYDGQAPERLPQTTTLEISAADLRALSHFDRAAIALTRKELGNIESLTRSLFECVQDLAGDSPDIRETTPSASPSARRHRLALPVPDADRLWCATFAGTVVAVGFLVWILFDPPGHASMYQLAGTVAMSVSAKPQLKATAFLKPFAVALLAGLAVYVFLLPRLSGFAELAPLIFAFVFVTCYFFNGLGRLAGLIAFINMVSIQNEQSYDFAAMANAYVFTLSAFVLVFVVSFMIGSPRSEKVFLHLLSRYFRSAEYLILRMAPSSGRPSSIGIQWRIDVHRQDLRSMPQKLAAWGRAIDQKKYPKIKPEQVQNLVTQLQVLTYRIEELLEAAVAPQSASLTRSMRDETHAWCERIEKTLACWSKEPEVAPAADLRDQLATWLARLEKRLDEALDRSDIQAFTEEDGQDFYQLLGGYRGVSEAVVAYAGNAAEIDWAHWREERF